MFIFLSVIGPSERMFFRRHYYFFVGYWTVRKQIFLSVEPIEIVYLSFNSDGLTVKLKVDETGRQNVYLSATVRNTRQKYYLWRVTDTQMVLLRRANSDGICVTVDRHELYFCRFFGYFWRFWADTKLWNPGSDGLIFGMEASHTTICLYIKFGVKIPNEAHKNTILGSSR